MRRYALRRWQLPQRLHGDLKQQLHIAKEADLKKLDNPPDSRLTPQRSTRNRPIGFRNQYRLQQVSLCVGLVLSLKGGQERVRRDNFISWCCFSRATKSNRSKFIFRDPPSMVTRASESPLSLLKTLPNLRAISFRRDFVDRSWLGNEPVSSNQQTHQGLGWSSHRRSLDNMLSESGLTSASEGFLSYEPLTYNP